MTNNDSSAQTRYIPVSKFDNYHPWPTPRGIRNRIHAAQRGTDVGFLDCIKWVGGRVLVDEQAFLRWVEIQADAETVSGVQT